MCPGVGSLPWDYCVIDGQFRRVMCSLIRPVIDRLCLQILPLDFSKFSTGGTSRHRGIFGFRGGELYLLDVINEFDRVPVLMLSELAALGWKARLRHDLRGWLDDDDLQSMPAEQVFRLLGWLAGDDTRAQPIRAFWVHEPEMLLALCVEGIGWGATAPPVWSDEMIEDNFGEEFATRIQQSGWLVGSQ